MPVFRSYVWSIEDFGWASDFGPFVKATAGYYLIRESAGSLNSFVDWLFFGFGK